MCDLNEIYVTTSGMMAVMMTLAMMTMMTIMMLLRMMTVMMTLMAKWMKLKVGPLHDVGGGERPN